MRIRTLGSLVDAADKVRERAFRLISDARYEDERGVEKALIEFADAMLRAEQRLVNKLLRSGYDLNE